MKTTLLLFLTLTVFCTHAQTLSLNPALSPPTELEKYTQSSITNSTILNTPTSDGHPFFQTNTNTRIDFSVNNGSPLMTLSNIGYLGLGTSSPTERLVINKGRIRLTGEESPSNPSSIAFTDKYATEVKFNLNMVDDNTLGIKSTAGTSNFLMNVNNGNVGIGNSPGSEALTINGGIHNTQFENVNNVSSPVIASANGDLLKGEMNTVSIIPSSYARFGDKTSANFTVVANMGYYTNSIGPDPYISAPIHIPNNVKIKNVTARLVDNSSNSYINIEILGIGLGIGTLGITNINSKSLPVNTTTTTINQNFIPHTTDCNSYYYVLIVSVLKTSDDSPTIWDSSNLKIGKVTITYGY